LRPFIREKVDTKSSAYLNLHTSIRDRQFIATHPTSRQRTRIHRSVNWYFSDLPVTELINCEL